MGTRERLLAPLRRSAPPTDPAARALTTVFGPDPLTGDRFSPELLARVPLERLRETVATLQERHGALRQVRRRRELYQLQFTHGAELVWATTDLEGRLTSLVTGPGALLAADSAPASGVFPAPAPAGDDAAEPPSEPLVPAQASAQASAEDCAQDCPEDCFEDSAPGSAEGSASADADPRTGARPSPPRPAAAPLPLAPAAAVLQRTVLGYAAATLLELTIPYLTDTATGWTLLLLQAPAFSWYVLRTAPAHTVPPWFRVLPLLPIAAAALAALRALPLLGPGLPWSRPGLPELFLFAAVNGLAVWTYRRSLPLRPSPSAHPLVLDSPLRGGCFALTEGGGPAVNRYAEESLLIGGSRAHRHAVDLVQLGEGPQWRGRRALGLAPASNERYAVHGHPVLSPCDGVVVTAVDGLPDHDPYRQDAGHPEGNHVAIDTGRALVVLSGLRKDSIAVRRGQHLTSGTPVAAVGNSGNGTEPALHLRAETRTSRPAPGGGTGLPFRLAELRGTPLRGRRFTVPD